MGRPLAAVDVVGSPPVITADGFDHSGGLHLQCESEGWYPEPDLEWLDSEGVSLRSETIETHRNTDRFTVKHTITVHQSVGKIHCRVKLRHHMLESLIITSSKMFHSWRTSVILISFAAVLLVIAGTLIVVFFHKNRAHEQLQKKIQHAHNQLENENRRIQHESSSEREELFRRQNMIITQVITHLRTHSVDVILDAATAHPRLIVSQDGKKMQDGNTQEDKMDANEAQYDKFDKYLGVLGKDGFSSGCFYYEVQVKGQTKWDLGVTGEFVNRKGLINLSPINGYWIIGLRDGAYWAYDSSRVFLCMRKKPQRVGVFVDYKEGLVSFYDVESMSHIYSYSSQSFNDKLYPFVSLGDLCNENPKPLIIPFLLTQGQGEGGQSNICSDQAIVPSVKAP